MVDLIQANPRSIAGIGAFRDGTRVLEALHAEFGAVVPTKPGFVVAGGVTVSCVAPSRFVASGERGADLPGRLFRALTGIAAVTDQSDMWDIWIVSGAGVGEVLARVVPIDLHMTSFGIGSLALTRAGHLDVRLWHVGSKLYEIAAARSFAGDLRHALETALRRL